MKDILVDAIIRAMTPAQQEDLIRMLWKMVDESAPKQAHQVTKAADYVRKLMNKDSCGR